MSLANWDIQGLDLAANVPGRLEHWSSSIMNVLGGLEHWSSSVMNVLGGLEH